jgi:hypothetical protein
MAAGTTLNNILRDAAKTPLLRMTVEIASPAQGRDDAEIIGTAPT